MGTLHQIGAAWVRCISARRMNMAETVRYQPRRGFRSIRLKPGRAIGAFQRWTIYNRDAPDLESLWQDTRPSGWLALRSGRGQCRPLGRCPESGRPPWRLHAQPKITVDCSEEVWLKAVPVTAPLLIAIRDPSVNFKTPARRFLVLDLPTGARRDFECVSTYSSGFPLLMPSWARQSAPCRPADAWRQSLSSQSLSNATGSVLDVHGPFSPRHI